MFRFMSFGVVVYWELKCSQGHETLSIGYVLHLRIAVVLKILSKIQF
jgi:chemotaxis methyl-accepting protein methylase